MVQALVQAFSSLGLAPWAALTTAVVPAHGAAAGVAGGAVGALILAALRTAPWERALETAIVDLKASYQRTSGPRAEARTAARQRLDERARRVQARRVRRGRFQRLRELKGLGASCQRCVAGLDSYFTDFSSFLAGFLPWPALFAVRRLWSHCCRVARAVNAVEEATVRARRFPVHPPQRG